MLRVPAAMPLPSMAGARGPPDLGDAPRTWRPKSVAQIGVSPEQATTVSRTRAPVVSTLRHTHTDSVSQRVLDRAPRDGVAQLDLDRRVDALACIGPPRSASTRLAASASQATLLCLAPIVVEGVAIRSVARTAVNQRLSSTAFRGPAGLTSRPPGAIS